MHGRSNESSLLNSKIVFSSASEARLYSKDASGKERYAVISTPVFTMGRGHENDFSSGAPNVSRQHALIQVADGRYILKDRNSRHGTYLNGSRVGEAELRHGDRIQLGGAGGEVVTFLQGNLLRSFDSLQAMPGESLSVRDFREMGLLMNTILKLNSISVLDDLMNLVVDTAIEITGAERGFIIIKDKEDTLRFRCARDAHKQTLDSSYIEASRRVPEEVMRTGVRQVISDLSDVPDDATHSSTMRIGIRSIACVPLRYAPYQEAASSDDVEAADTIGVLYVDSQYSGNLQRDSQMEALETLAKETASAIYGARLHIECQEKERLDQELAVAQAIQQALLPPPNKVLPYVNACSLSLPCRQIGGDYFDYFNLADGRLGFAVGDVSGKGVPAALMAAKIQGILSAQSFVDLPLPEVIAKVNGILTERRIEYTFATFFFGILDGGGNCTYTNAGHIPPIVVKPDGSMSEMAEGGTVLGLFADEKYESATTQVTPGDHVILFTDGVLEARNPAGEQYGKQRILSILRKYAGAQTCVVLEQLKQDLNSFCADAPQHDDITIMVLGFREDR
jgi:sigma-B regulation protein RsbU (phosphoserine phosphatase)